MPSRAVRCRVRRRRAGPAALAAVAVVLLTVAGCTTTQPDRTTSGSASPSVPQALPQAVSQSGAAGRTVGPSATARSTTTATSRVALSTTTTAPRPTTTPTTPTTGGGCVSRSCYRPGEIHQLPPGVAPESSGITASATMPGAFFVVDDGTGTAEIVAIRSDGSLVARIAIAGMSARNAEALSAGPCGSRPGRCLYVGDIGDNDARRASITVYRVVEPSLSPPPRSPLPADTWRYTYPDGPHDAEALVVLPDGSMLILTKSTPDKTTGQVPPHRIYRAPAGGGPLTFVSSYRPPNPATALQSLFTGTVVTDASSTAGRMLLLTYDEVVEYRAPRPGADPAGFPSWPHTELPAPAMIQSEGITADLAGCGYEVTSEEGPDGTRAGLAGVACG